MKDSHTLFIVMMIWLAASVVCAALGHVPATAVCGAIGVLAAAFQIFIAVRSA